MKVGYATRSLYAGHGPKAQVQIPKLKHKLKVYQYVNERRTYRQTDG